MAYDSFDRARPFAATPPPPTAPPTRASLKAWWALFRARRPNGAAQSISVPYAAAYRYPPYGKEIGDRSSPNSHKVFGVPLRESLKYASVQISTANSNGELYVWGDIPVVVAKCGLFLKENATEVEGTFRVSGSSKRMRELQTIFETPPKYGKSLDWKKEHYTPHDVASVFRRYLTQLAEPVIPCELYGKFRETLYSKGAKKRQSTDEIIRTYKQLIRKMPLENQYLLLYVLDLLSVFARKSDKNLMTASNLAVTFRPCLISHPQHELLPEEHRLSQEVLEFLIEHQDWFMLDVPPPPDKKGNAKRRSRVLGDGDTAEADTDKHAAPSGVLTGGHAAFPGRGRVPSDGSSHSNSIVIGSGASETGGGWRLVEKSELFAYEEADAAVAVQEARESRESRESVRTRTRIGRRRSSSAASTGNGVDEDEGDGVRTSSPGFGFGLGMGTVGVTRSRTLPSRSSTVRSTATRRVNVDSEDEHGRKSDKENQQQQQQRKMSSSKRREEDLGAGVRSMSAGSGAGSGSGPSTYSSSPGAGGRSVLRKKRASVQPMSPTKETQETPPRSQNGSLVQVS